MQFSASASSTLDPDIPSPFDGSVPLVHVNPAFDCRVCFSPLPASGCRCRERRGGEEVRTGRPAWITKTRVLLATNRCCMHGRQFNVDGDVSRFSWPSLSETPFGWFNSGGLAWDATHPLPFLSTAASPHLAHHQQHAGSRFSPPQPHFDLALLHWDNVVWDSSPTAAGHAVRGLMRSYVTRLNGGLSPRVLLVQLNTDASDATSLACQQSASLIRVINKRLHTCSSWPVSDVTIA